ncbi:MAG TPA: UDP-N-acetylmuramoyl-tripeptide--D-alanyl-D-alanine ligase [Burkholderiales bacterium]|nr:UDP-N-acetylmuramoyl-tripeptide--D-alanyl-D-alanine ligase [Burkholderiales bacterium]
MAMMGIAEAARALDAGIHGGDVTFDAVNTDSRAIKRGDLFVALKGERFDGHRFVPQAAAAGAAAAMVETPELGMPASETGLPLIVVKDTRLALGRLGAYWRGKFSMPVVALTGSSGKTTVKEMLAAILRAAGTDSAVLATRGNLNNDIGMPLMLLELRSGHRYAVIEMGMNHAGEIRYLTRLAAPDVALVNNAGHAHIEYLGSEEAIARAKGEIFEGLGDDGVAVINADERFAGVWRGLAAGRKVIEFGIEKPAAVTATYRLGFLESEIVVKTPHGEAAAMLNAAGLHNVKNALAASAVAVALDVEPPAIAAGLARFAGVKGRLQKKACLRGATLIDDTYNANPESMRAAVAVLARAPGSKLLVLGDMGELGPDAPALHAEIGQLAREAGIERLFTLGDLSARATQAFGGNARHFSRIEDLLAEIENLLAPGVTILVKGSRFMQMERVVRSFEPECDTRPAEQG